jgi:hypothetical protein
LNRPQLFSQEQGRTFDVLSGYKDALTALGQLAADLLFGNAAGALNIIVVGGFGATPGAGLTVALAVGSIYQRAAIDATAYGALAIDTTLVIQQGAAIAQNVTLTTTGLSSGQSRWALIEVAFGAVDVVRTGDPTGGVLPYVNAANPQEPLQGPGGSGAVQNTVRQGVASIRVLYGGVATTGSETPPNPDAGYVPLYLVDLAYGQTSIAQNQIIVAAPSAGVNVPSNYPFAPFLSRFLGGMLVGANTAPTAASGAQAGSGPPAPAVTPRSTDVRGTITFGTGTGPSVGGMVNVTFSTPYVLPPTVVLTPLNAASAALQLHIVGGATASGFSVGAAVAPSGGQGNGVYGFTYAVLGA